jgi:hypothetical protein
MSKIGRPSKFTPATVKRIVRSVARGVPLCHAANAAGVSYQTLCTHRSSYPKFADALTAAVSKAVEARLKVVERATRSKDESVRLRASCWYLEHVHPESFARSRVELTGKDNQPFVPAVVAPVVQFVIPDNGRGPSLGRPAQIAEHVRKAGG